VHDVLRKAMHVQHERPPVIIQGSLSIFKSIQKRNMLYTVPGQVRSKSVCVHRFRVHRSGLCCFDFQHRPVPFGGNETTTGGAPCEAT